MAYDVFISYSRTSKDEAVALQQALSTREMRIYRDETEIPEGAPFPPHLADALLGARVVVLMVDEHYFRRPFCVLEYAVALAPYRQHPTEPHGIDHLVVGLGENVDEELLHLPPPMANRSWPGGRDTERLAGLVIERLADQEETLGDKVQSYEDQAVARLRAGGEVPVPSVPTVTGSGATSPMMWTRGAPTTLGGNFVGRRADLWLLFHILETLRALGEPASLVIEGSDGLGKTRLAAEYLWRYGARCYPGGVVWVDASLDPDSAEVEFQALWQRFAAHGDGTSGDIRGDLAELFQRIAAERPVLWIIDDLGVAGTGGQRPARIETWCPPHQHVTVLATSARTGLANFAQRIQLDELDEEAAVALLTRAPVSKKALTSFEWSDVVHWVGRLPLALVLLRLLLEDEMLTPAELIGNVQRREAVEAAIDTRVRVSLDELPEGTLSGIRDTYELAYEALERSPEALAAAHRMSWLAGRRVGGADLDELMSREDRVLLTRRSWLVHRPAEQDEVSRWYMPAVLGSFLRALSPEPADEMGDVLSWIRRRADRSEPDRPIGLGWELAAVAFDAILPWLQDHPESIARILPRVIDEATALAAVRLGDFGLRGVRGAASELLVALGHDEALVARLEHELERGGDEVAKSVAAQFGSLGGSMHAAEALVPLLGDPRTQVRYQASLSAMNLGHPEVLGVPLVSMLLRERSPAADGWIVGVQNTLQPHDPALRQVLPVLLEALHYGDEDARARAARILGRLLSRLGDGLAAGGFRAAGIRGALLHVAVDQGAPSSVSAQAGAALGSDPQNEMHSALLDAVRHADPASRPRAADVLMAYLDAVDRVGAPGMEVVRREEGAVIRGSLGEPPPQDPELYRELLSWLIEHDDDLFRQLLPRLRTPSARLALVDIALDRLDNGHYEEVVAIADDVEAAQPSFSSTFWWRAQAREALGQLDLAISDYGRVLEATPEFDDAARRLALVQQRAGRPEDALNTLDVHFPEPGADADIHFLRSVAFAAMSHFEEALQAIERALSIVPDDVEFLHLRAYVLGNLQRWHEALPVAEKAATLAPPEGRDRYDELVQWLEANTPDRGPHDDGPTG